MDKSPADSPSLLTRTRRLLRRYGLRARKALGQHFLVDGEVLEAIIAAAGLTPADTVIEVGPGIGVLTGELARQAGWVIAIELDNNLATILKKTMAPFDNVVILNEDILGTDPKILLDKTDALCTHALSTLLHYVTILEHDWCPVKMGLTSSKDPETAYMQCVDPGEPYTEGGTVIFAARRIGDDSG